MFLCPFQTRIPGTLPAFAIDSHATAGDIPKILVQNGRKESGVRMHMTVGQALGGDLKNNQ